MNTDQLVQLLARAPAPVDPRAATRRVALAALAGAALALAALLATLGLNPRLVQTAAAEPMVWVKCAFVLTTALAALALVLVVGRPGAPLPRALQRLAAPLVLLWGVAAAVLLQAPDGARLPLVFGATWRMCPWLIAGFSVPTFVLLLAAMRTLAPTRPRLAGAAAGFAAGAVAASVYQLHCPELAAPFLAVWYVAGMLVPTAAGALLGPRVLRW